MRFTAILIGISILSTQPVFAQINPQDKAQITQSKRLTADEADRVMEQGWLAQTGKNASTDYKRAFDLYHQVFAAGYYRGAEGLAYLYQNGLGVPQDNAMANKWLTIAFGMGSVLAGDSLGDSFLQGRAVTQDYKRAFTLYNVVAQAGNINAQIKLSGMYSKGIGTDRNETMAYYWVCVAANQPNNIAGLAQARKEIGESLGASVQAVIEQKALNFRSTRLVEDKKPAD